jgi:molecular chaperone HtpG
MNANMERIMRAMNQAVPESKRVLELNPDHPIVRVMGDMYQQSADDARLLDYADLLYDQALLTEGTPIKDPLKFTKLVSELMVKAAK